MRRITRVDILDNQTLDIEFDNGHVLLLDLNTMRADPAISALLDSGGWCQPQTDGTAIYWQDGPQLNIEQLINELIKEGGKT